MKETNRVVILAAGRGSRMIGLTKNSPKCLVKINKRPILYWLIEIIENSAVDNIQIICGYLESLIKTKYKIEISYKNIAVTAGASAGIFMALITLFDPGSLIAVSSPGYPCYRNIINTLGLKTHLIPTDKENNFQLTPKLIENLPKNITTFFSKIN